MRTCDADTLAIEVVDVPGASGASYARITIVNTAAAPCAVQGYPAVGLLDAARSPIGQTAYAIPGSAELIVLGKGDAASTLLQDATSQCNADPAAFVEVSAPGGAPSVTVPTELRPCALSVRSLVPGMEPQP